MSFEVPSESRPNSSSKPRVVQGVIALASAVLFLQAMLLGDLVPSALAFSWDGLGKGQWWTPFTYPFVHAGIWHLAVTMYGLFLFGPRLERAWGSRRFARYFMFAALGGLLAHVLFVRQGTLFGASAAVYGVMAAYAMQWPETELHFFGLVPMRAWTAVLVLVGFDLLQGIVLAPTADPAYLAHLGGFVVAWFYARTPAGGSIDQLRQRMAQAPDPTDEPPRAIPRSQPRARDRAADTTDEIVARSKAAVANRQIAAPPVRPPRETPREELDRVLDKISSQGLDSLTDDERRALEAASRKLRDQ